MDNPNPCWNTLLQSFGEPGIILPGQLKEIEEYAFVGIIAKVIYIHDGCESIGDYAFANSSITKIRLPANCEISESAFDGCSDVVIYSSVSSNAEKFCATHNNCIFAEE